MNKSTLLVAFVLPVLLGAACTVNRPVPASSEPALQTPTRQFSVEDPTQSVTAVPSLTAESLPEYGARPTLTVTGPPRDDVSATTPARDMPTPMAKGLANELGFSPEPGADGLGDPYDLQLGNGGYDAQHYTLDLSVDVPSNTISGTVTMRAVATQDLSAFNLDFIGFDVSQVLLDGVPVDYEREAAPEGEGGLRVRPGQLASSFLPPLTLEEQGREMTVISGSPLRSGQPFTVELSYSGSPEPFYSQAVPFPMGWTAYEGGIFVASEPDASASWFPVNDHPLDKATYSFTITVPEPYVVAANGLLQEVVDNGDTRTYVWEASDPLASYLVTVDIAEYVMQTEEGPDGLPIRNFFPPELAEDAAYDFGRTVEMIELYSELFGPYPFEAYGVVVVGDVPFALETQTLSVFGTGAVTGERMAEEVVAHELAHQWFGDSVSLARWGDIWLNEGFARYAQLLWLEHVEGAEPFEHRIRNLYDVVAGNLWKGLPPQEIRERLAQLFPPPGDPPSDDLFNSGVYDRGALTLHALRQRVGDQVFFEILRTYHGRFRHATATTADFVGVAEQVSGQDLEEFFHGWLFEQALPDIPEMGLLAPDLGS